MSTTTRPAALMSAAAAALAGANPLTVSDIAADHPMLAAAVRDLAAATGEPVPAMYADRDTIADLIGLDPREGFPYSAHEAEDEYNWARENGLADDEIAYGDLDPATALDPEADEHPSDYADGPRETWHGEDNDCLYNYD